MLGIEVKDPSSTRFACASMSEWCSNRYNLFPHRTALQNVMMAPIKVLKRPRKEVEAGPINYSGRYGWMGRNTLIRASSPGASSNAWRSPVRLLCSLI